MSVFWHLLVISCLSCEWSRSVLANTDNWESPVDNFFYNPSTEEQAEEVSVPVKPNDVADNQYIKKTSFPKEYKKETNACSPFFTRFINILANSIKLQGQDIPEKELKKMSIDIWVSQRTLTTLKKFGSGEAIPLDLLDESFVNLFNHDDSYRTQFLSYIYDSTSGLLSTIFNENTAWTMLLLSPIAIFAISVLRNGFNFSSLFTFVVFIYYVGCVGVDLLGQYEDIQIRRTHILEETLTVDGTEKIPDECFPSKLSTSSKIFYLVFGGNCEKYIKSKKNIWSEIDLQQAFTKPILNFLFTALPQVGDKAGESVQKFSSHFFYPFNWIVALVLVYCIGTSCVPVFFHMFTTIPFYSSIHAMRRYVYQSDSGFASVERPSTVPQVGPPSSSGGTTVNNFHYYNPPPLPLQAHGNNPFPTNAITFRNPSTKQLREFQKRRQDHKREVLLSKKEKKKNK